MIGQHAIKDHDYDFGKHHHHITAVHDIPDIIVDLHASKDHPGEQLIINAWHCVGHGEELVRGLSSRGMILFLCSRGMLLFIVFKRYLYCNILTQSIAYHTIPIRPWFPIFVLILRCPFYDFHTHFCSLQQPMRETVCNKNKKRVFCNTCCKQRRHCKREYIAKKEGSLFISG